MHASLASPQRDFCEATEAYLLGFSQKGVTADVLRRYLERESRPRVELISDVYWQLLWSAQNANMRTGVITGSMDDGMMALSGVLLSFVPSEVATHYCEDYERLLDDIVDTVHPRGQVRRSKGSIWPLFCRSALTGARFLTQFDDAAAFYRWADGYIEVAPSNVELPLAVSRQVDGVGFALACDFLKELGYSEFGKPDVHVKKILLGLGVVPQSADDRAVFEALIRFASAAGREPYYVDKLMWLLGSGKFYLDPEIGRVPTDRDGFVAGQRPLFVSGA